MRYERLLITLALVCLLVAPAFAMPSEKGAWNCHYGGMFLLSDLTEEEMENMTLAELKALREEKMEEMENMTLAELEVLRSAKMDARQEERENMTLGELRENCSAKGNGKAQPAGGSCPMSGCADHNNMRADQGRGDQAMFGGQNMRGGQGMDGQNVCGGFGPGMGIDIGGPCLFLLMDLTEEEMEDMTLAELKVLREEKMEEMEDMTLAELKALRDEKMENMTIGEMKGMCGGLGGIGNLRRPGAGNWGAM